MAEITHLPYIFETEFSIKMTLVKCLTNLTEGQFDKILYNYNNLGKFSFNLKKN